MSAAENRAAPRPRAMWATDAQVHTHVMALWWADIHFRRRRPKRLRAIGNVVYLPAPIAGYRLRHDGTSVVVEIKPSHANAILIGRCAHAAAARDLLGMVSAEHRRPFLGEIGTAAA